MGKDLIISSNSHETKIAIVEDEQLVETYFQRANEYSLVGSIHKGRVTRVLPGMQSAFVNIGLDRDAFLYVSDFFEENEEEYEPVDTGEAKPNRHRNEEAAAPANQGNKQEPAGRERRGRRPRRRRSKGRGLPESKYASEVKSEPAAPEAETPQPEKKKKEEASDEFLFLPGESLAKYSHAEQATSTGEQAAEATPDDDSSNPIVVEADHSTAAGSAVEPTGDQEAGDSTLQELMGTPPNHENAGPGTLSAERRGYFQGSETGDTETSQELPAGEREPAAAIGEQAGKPIVDDDPETESGAGEAEDGEEPENNSEPEDGDIKEMILGQLAESPADSEQEGNGSEKAGKRKTGGKKAGARQASAKVREQEPRYQHRVSRRGRRRGGRAAVSEAGHDEAQDQPEEPVPVERKDQHNVSRPEKPPLPLISDLLKAGQEILVQVAKEPLGQKGARITSHIALPGRYVVYMPTVDHLGVSRKIASDEERQRLRTILQKNRAGIPGGFIMRTAGEGKSEKEIVADITFLSKLWADIRQAAEKKPAPALLHHDLRIIERVLRDQVTDDFNTIWIDNEEAYENTLRFLQRFQPSLVNRVRLYTRSAPIFDAFGVSQELEKALRPKVWLKSGGYIVINQTEALVAIDINTGKYVGKSNRLEDTIVKTNVEAVKEIVRQMRLRDLGGIIVIDFIDMDERKNRQRVMQALEEALRQDRAPSKILQFNEFGLVAITRKRVKQSLERTLCSPCPYCGGAGYVKSIDTVIGEIITEAHKLAPALDSGDVVLRVHPDVAKVLKSSKNDYIQELEEILGRTLIITADPLLHHEKFDLA